MQMKWVLVGFCILYLLFALSFLPVERILPPPTLNTKKKIEIGRFTTGLFHVGFTATMRA